MEKMRALIANEPPVYREVIADALKMLRPLLEVFRSGPEELDREVERLHPHLVICSRLTASVRGGCPSWVVLYPEGEDWAEIGGGGRTTTLVAGVQIDDLLSVVDETALGCTLEDDR